MKLGIQATIAVVVLVFITVFFYWIEKTQLKLDSKAPVHIAKPDWYVSNMEWQPHMVLYDGDNYYYSQKSSPKN